MGSSSRTLRRAGRHPQTESGDFERLLSVNDWLKRAVLMKSEKKEVVDYQKNFCIPNILCFDIGVDSPKRSDRLLFGKYVSGGCDVFQLPAC